MMNDYGEQESSLKVEDKHGKAGQQPLTLSALPTAP